MLRQHVYYSITFIPGQFTPDIWTVDLENSVTSFDTVNVINSQQWEVPENLWHRSTLFTAVQFGQDSWNTNQVVETLRFNTLILNDDQVSLNSVVEKSGTLKTALMQEDSLTLSEFITATILRTPLFNTADLVINDFVVGEGRMNTLILAPEVLSVNDTASGYGSFKTISFSLDDKQTNLLAEGMPSNNVLPHAEGSVESKAFNKGKIGWNRPQSDQVQVAAYASNDIVFGASFESQETSSTIFEAV